MTGYQRYFRSHRLVQLMSGSAAGGRGRVVAGNEAFPFVVGQFSTDDGAGPRHPLCWVERNLQIPTGGLEPHAVRICVVARRR